MHEHLNQLDELEAEAIHIIRETVAEFERPVMLYSVGKDSSVMLHLARKALAPAPLPFALLHVDTGFKFEEMYAFRDAVVAEQGLELRVYRQASVGSATPWTLGTSACCSLLKTQALLEALRLGQHDAALGGARREEERSRAKERVFSMRTAEGGWDPKAQRPELWRLYNGRCRPGESVRVFPLSNWTELDIWRYVEREAIAVVPMYFARQRGMVERDGQLIPIEGLRELRAGERARQVLCRFRTLGCAPCSGAVRSTATTVAQIIEELLQARHSERVTRVIDHDQDGSMELKKREGYF